MWSRVGNQILQVSRDGLCVEHWTDVTGWNEENTAHVCFLVHFILPIVYFTVFI